ncbi:MAG: antitoxin family protein [Hormoscilla sp. GUM202]|nr:antitoxin family protein [Hormoscilla sp. GM7CHS1pb]MBO1348011.1 antitoxin family protein [Hormoscilla sp. GUM202]
MEKKPEIIVAVYENGMLRPQDPVSLSEGQKVRLRVVGEVAHDPPKTELDKAFQLMVDEGWLRLPPKHGQVEPAEHARRVRARKLVKIQGKPLSETIIEERGSW